jgi:alanyl-tRNA synthetase
MASEIRAKYLKFFADHGHAVIPAIYHSTRRPHHTIYQFGMRQMVPYLKCQALHGVRIVDSHHRFALNIEKRGQPTFYRMFEILAAGSGGLFQKGAVTLDLGIFYAGIGSPRG